MGVDPGGDGGGGGIYKQLDTVLAPNTKLMGLFRLTTKSYGHAVSTFVA